MIEVFAKKRGGYYRLYVTGHADYAPGHDIVCAGVSALVLALREELLQLEEAGAVSIRRLQLEPGFADIRCVPGTNGEGTELVYDTVVKGLELLQKLFGEFVEVRRIPLK